MSELRMTFKISTLSVLPKSFMDNPYQNNPNKVDFFVSIIILFLMARKIKITTVFENKSNLDRGGLPSEYFSEDCSSHLLTCDVLLPAD